MTQQVDNLIFDVSGLLYRTYYKSKSQPTYRVKGSLDEEDDDNQADAAGLALHSALNSMLKFFNMFKPNRVVACFDRPNNWRKQYMASKLSISARQYKGTRRQNQTEAQKRDFQNFIEHAQEFERLLQEETGILTLAGDMLEADDCISGWTQRFHDQRNIIASNDSDMQQLITDTTDVCNFTSGELVECPDPKYFLFEKTFRGDTADNIVSTYPGIRSTRLKKAYDNPYDLANLLAEPYVTPTGEQLTVRDILEENQLLIDLSKQPPAIRKLIDRTIDDELAKTKRFDFWKFSAFCNRNKLKHISSNLQTFRPLLVGGYSNVR